MDDDKKNLLIKYSVIGFLVLVFIVICLALYISFGSHKTEKKNNVQKNVSLVSGDKYTLDKTENYTWDSTDKGVAIVSNDGKIEALKEGDATVTITTDSETIVYTVHVDKIDKSVNLVAVKMYTNTLTINQGESYNMVVNIIPNNATNSDLTWYSSNPDVVKVENGVITGIGAGTCMVTVKSSNGNVDNCLVKVKGSSTGDSTITDIILDVNSIVLKNGIEYTLDYKIMPSESPNNIEWIVGDSEVATVEDGVIKTKKSGSTVVIARSGEIESEVYITVVDGTEDTPDVIDDGKTVHAETISLNQEIINLEIGETYLLMAEVLPENTTNKSVSWLSSNEEIVTIDEDGLVTAIGEGEATITAFAENDIFAFCDVKVKSKEEDNYEITLDMSNAVLSIGETIQLSETITPDNYVSDIEWSSSNESVATVNNGLVTAVNDGEATITAKLSNGNSASCYISVSTKVIKVMLINLNVEQINIKENGTAQLSYTVLPSTATNKTVTWSSSNTSVATVDGNGKVTAKSAGAAIITAKSTNGVTAKASVIVSPLKSITFDKTKMELKVNQTGKLTVTVVPASDKGKVSWKSSDTSVATVNTKGEVTARKNGTAKITATVNNQTATCTVTVTNSSSKGATTRSYTVKDYKWNNNSYKFWLYAPKTNGEAMPLVVYLRGDSHVKSDVNMVNNYGFSRIINEGGDYPFYMISPFCGHYLSYCSRGLAFYSEGNLHGFVMELVNYMIKNYNIDTNRIILVGEDTGGDGAYYMGSIYRNTFSSLVIVDARGFSYNEKSTYKKFVDPKDLTYLPIWVFQSKELEKITVNYNDEDIDIKLTYDPYEEAVKYVNRLKAAGANVKFTAIDGTYKKTESIFSNQELINWMLSQKKK